MLNFLVIFVMIFSMGSMFHLFVRDRSVSGYRLMHEQVNVPSVDYLAGKIPISQIFDVSHDADSESRFLRTESRFLNKRAEGTGSRRFNVPFSVQVTKSN